MANSFQFCDSLVSLEEQTNCCESCCDQVAEEANSANCKNGCVSELPETCADASFGDCFDGHEFFRGDIADFNRNPFPSFCCVVLGSSEEEVKFEAILVTELGSEDDPCSDVVLENFVTSAPVVSPVSDDDDGSFLLVSLLFGLGFVFSASAAIFLLGKRKNWRIKESEPVLKPLGMSSKPPVPEKIPVFTSNIPTHGAGNMPDFLQRFNPNQPADQVPPPTPMILKLNNPFQPSDTYKKKGQHQKMLASNSNNFSGTSMDTLATHMM